jgi:hypothetical protein
MRQTLEDDLRLLAGNLPLRFTREIDELLDNLSSMLDSLPAVLTHGDLNEMNFLVDESSGHLTGVIDWAEAKILPFGMNLWGFENILGYMDLNGWHYFDQHASLRTLFWETFNSTVVANEATVRLQSVIDCARRMGILLRYGFRWDENMQRKVVEDGSSSTKYLDALLS